MDVASEPSRSPLLQLSVAERATALKELEAEVRVCLLCKLAHTRTHAVPGDGSFTSVVSATSLPAPSSVTTEPDRQPVSERGSAPLSAQAPPERTYCTVRSLA